MTPITNHPAVRYMGSGRWTLTDPLTYFHPDFGEIVVPAGFDTDMDSVPRLPFAYWLTKDASVTGAVLHDFLYSTGTIGDKHISRAEADRIFLDVMVEEDVSWWQRRMVWLGVRTGGWLPWNRYRGKDHEPDFV